MKRLIKFWLLVSSLCLIASGNLVAQHSFWNRVQGPFGKYAWSMLVANDGTYLAGTGDGKIYTMAPKTEDWSITLNTDFTITMMYQTSSGSIFIGNDNGELDKSDDSGFNWENDGGKDLTGVLSIRAMAESKTGALFIGTNIGIYKKSSDTWEKINFNEFVFTLRFDNNGVLYAGTFTGVYYSKDDGNTWEKISSTLQSVYCIIVDSQNNVLLGTDSGVYRNSESDSDTTWNLISIPNVRVRQLLLNPDQSRLYAGFDNYGFVFAETADFTNWYLTDLDFISIRSGIAYDTNRDGLVIGTSLGVWTSFDSAKTFEQIGLPENIKFITHTGDRLIANVNNGKNLIYESADNGLTWNLFNINAEGSFTCYAENKLNDRLIAANGGFSGSAWINLQYHADKLWYYLGAPADVHIINTIYITQQDSMLLGTDKGLYFVNTVTYDIDSIPNQGAVKSENILSILQLSEKIFLLGTSNGYFISEDGGLTWPTHNLTGITVNQITSDNTGMIYLVTNAGIYQLSDIHSKETPLNSVPGEAFSSLVFDKTNSPYAVSKNDVYFSDNVASKWSSVSAGIESPDFHGLTYFGKDVFIATNRGIFKHTESSVSVEDNSNSENLTQFTLYANYPNPFNPETTIRFYTARQSQYDFEVYNLLGEQIYSSTNRTAVSGQNVIEFNGNNLSSGIYFYKIKIGSVEKTGKMILQK